MYLQITELVSYILWLIADWESFHSHWVELSSNLSIKLIEVSGSSHLKVGLKSVLCRRHEILKTDESL